MTRRVLMAVALAAFFALPSPARAQRGYRGGQVTSPFGPMYNTASPEWRQSGGNPFVYQQLMEQKMVMAQQKAMTQQMQQYQKQQQAFQKWLKDQKAKKDKGQPTDPMYDQYLKAQADQQAAALKASTPKTKAKARTKRGTNRAAAKAKADADSSTTAGENKAGDKTEKN